MAQKLSELMEQGAKVLEPHANGYFDDNAQPTRACAIGCVFYALNITVDDTEGIKRMPEWAKDILSEYFVTSDFPFDVQGVLPQHDKFNLFKAITEINDNKSRRRAIEITKELGY